MRALLLGVLLWTGASGHARADEVLVFAQNLKTGQPWPKARVLLSNGDRTFSMPSAPQSANAFGFSTSTAIATDFDGNGDLDFVVGISGDYIRVMLGDGEGNLTISGDFNWLIGIGGLGQMAVQILRAVSAARIVAGDVDDAKLARARGLGVTHTVNTRSGDALEAVRALSGPRGAAVALDFVGAQDTIDLCARLVGRNSRLTIVGLAGGTLHYSANTPPYGCAVTVPYWGSRTELMEVIALAAEGRIRPEVERFPLDQAGEVYRRLREGRIMGRAVLVP